MQMQLELGVKVPIVIAGDPEPHETNAVFVVDAVNFMLPNIDEGLLMMLHNAVRRQVLTRSHILSSQTKV